MTSKKFKLYIWPHHWDLPSFDADCLSCVFFLQLSFAGQYSLVECTDPDVSPSGTFPFLEVHEDVDEKAEHSREREHENVGSSSSFSKSAKTVVTARSILAYLERIKSERNGEGGLRGNGDHEEHMGKAQRIAWSAFVSSKLRDLFNHVLYANPDNYKKGIHRALADILPIPSRYYVPGRLRDQVRQTLEPAGLWSWTADEEEEKPKKHPFDKPLTIVDEKDKIIKEAFGKEKLLDKAREVFDLLNPLLGHRSFFLANQPTSLDVQIASYLLILSHADLPTNPVLQLLNNNYPDLIDHSERMLSLAFPASHSESTAPTPEIIKVPHANAILQIGRTVGRVLHSVLVA